MPALVRNGSENFFFLFNAETNAGDKTLRNAQLFRTLVRLAHQRWKQLINLGFCFLLIAQWGLFLERRINLISWDLEVFDLFYLACDVFLFFKLVGNLFEAEVDVDQRLLVTHLILLIFLVDLIPLVLLALTLSLQADVDEPCCSFFYLLYRRPFHLLELNLFILVLELSEVEFVRFFLWILLLLSSLLIDILSVGIHLLDKIRKQSYCFFLCYIYPSHIRILLLWLAISILWGGVWIAFAWDICFEVAIVDEQSVLRLWFLLVEIEESG